MGRAAFVESQTLAALAPCGVACYQNIDWLFSGPAVRIFHAMFCDKTTF